MEAQYNGRIGQPPIHPRVLASVLLYGMEMIAVCEEVQDQFALPSLPSMAADGLMATGANIAGCEERGITFYSPVPQPDPATNPALRDDPAQPVAQADWERLPTHPLKVGGKACRQLDKTAFIYDEARDCYWCPLGQPLHYASTTSEARGRGRRVRRRYHADAKSCSACALCKRCVMGKCKSRENQPRTVRRARGTARAAHGPTGIANEVRAATPRGRTSLCDHQTPVWGCVNSCCVDSKP